jgi:hypothetical protein
MQIAWLDCPFENINDPYPGLCNRYTDTDGNEICDHSEPQPADRQEQVAGQVIGEAASVDTDAINKIIMETAPTDLSVDEVLRSRSNAYIQQYMWGVYIPIACYFVYWYLVEKAQLKKPHAFFTQKVFRLFWNIVLLVSFLVAGVTGILMLVSPSRDISIIHNYAGLVMFVVAVMHIIVRWHYFKILLKDITKEGKNS